MTDWINPDGTFGNLETAPQEVRDFVEKKKSTGISDVLKSYMELETYKGVPADRFVVVPEKQDDAEGWSRVHDKLGRPKTPSEYKDTFTAGEITLPKEILAKFREAGHKKGMSNELYNETIQFYIDAMTETLKIENENKEKANLEAEGAKKVVFDNLKKKYSAPTDEKMNEIILKGKKAAEDTGLLPVFEKFKLMDNPEVIDAMIAFSSRVTPSAIPPKQPETTKTNEQRLQEILNDKDFVDAMSPRNKELQAEFIKLTRIPANG
jgi:hypothetical protein